MADPGSSLFAVSLLEAGPTVVWLQGEHDITTDGDLQRALAGAIAANGAAVVLDLSEVDFMSASTLGVIVAARRFLRHRSRSLTVRSPSTSLVRILDICGLSDLLGPSPRPGEGLAGHAPGPEAVIPAARRSAAQTELPATVAQRTHRRAGDALRACAMVGSAGPGTCFTSAGGNGDRE